MTRFSKTLAVGMMLALGSAAHAAPQAVTIRTASLTPDPAGYLYCSVRADSATSVDVTTRIIAVDGSDVTEFGSSFVASPSISDDRRYHIDNDMGSMHDDARYCEVTIRRARKRDLHVAVTFESRDANGTVLTTVEAH